MEAFISEAFLASALAVQLWGIWRHLKLAKRTGWMLPFVLWAFICVGMAIPRVLSELISWGFFYRGFAVEVQKYTFMINSILVVSAARAFSKHMDGWIDHINELEAKVPIVTEVEEDADARSEGHC